MERRAATGLLLAGNGESHTGAEGYPLLALAIAAIVGMAIGYGAWALAEGPSEAPPKPASSALPSRTGAVPRSHIEVLRE
jgi:hypothetical protein